MEVRISIPKICWKAYVLSIVLKVRGKNKVLQKLQCKFCSWLLQLQKQCSIRAFMNGESIRNMGKLTEKQQESLEKLFHIAYHVALRGRPYTDFVHELKIQKLHKVEFFKTKWYENESSCRDFINLYSTSIFEETVRKKLVNPNFISILCDGSTDSSVVEKECIYVLFVDPETFQPNISFFHLEMYLLKIQ